MLKIGNTAPSFTLFSSEKNEVSLSDFQGQSVVILFFPLAFTGVCTTELCNTRDDIQSYKNLNAQVIAISVDSLFTLEKFKAEQNLNFPLLADFNRTVSADYGCLYEDFVLGGSICAAYADDTVGKTTNDNVLLAFIMGEQAAYLSGLGSDAAIIQALLAELDLMYNNQASLNFLNGVVFDWTKEPYIKGAYGFSTINMGDTRKIAAQPIDNKLFFAGEAMNINGHHQTVHGAVRLAPRAGSARAGSPRGAPPRSPS
jgi:peroxiredoxin